MPTIFVHNTNNNIIERLWRGLNDPMPYSMGRTLSVREFRANSCSNFIWTTRQTMEAWNNLRAAFNTPIRVGAAFRRIWEGRHAAQSQHYAGTALDIGQGMTQAQRNRIHALAMQSRAWGHVDPLWQTPTWVHVDRRFGVPACAGGAGYPTVRQGSRGVYVLVLQDALTTLGFTGSALDGVFGPRTDGMVREFQRQFGLVADGIVGCNTWRAVTMRTVGIGQRATTLHRC
ncbi:MAG: peptidoglycan-binding protein [Oscillospiraceae bacterium]|nr:peptidoglycan-binding protein [Oscillospiraceae bacterium]